MKRWLSPLRDSEIIACIDTLCDEFEGISGSISYPGGNLSIPLTDNETAEKLKQVNGFAISSFHIQYGQYNLSYNLNHNQNSSPLALIEVSLGTNSGTPGQSNFYFECMRLLVVPPPLVIENDSRMTLASFKQIETALGGAVSQFAKLQRDYQIASDEMRRMHLEELEAERKNYQNRESQKDQELLVERQKLAEQQRQLDDRSNTHVRREIRKELKNAISESLNDTSLTAGFDKNRRSVRYYYFGGLSIIALFALLNYYFIWLAFYEGSTTQNVLIGAQWWLGAKAAVATVSFVGFLLLFLKWETQWLRQQANFESILASTKIDIDRASWIAETLLEWNRASPEKDIPEELLQSFTRRLFDWDGRVEENASESLASTILGAAGKLQIGPQGTQVEFGRRGVKKLINSDE
ncbi:hypothetical protein [Aestuariivirga sp.]|jgi:hypothetical protein|uniref:hypothetical protein n=1 Tax=Aestuariivirga sp. TaxID=2650926 RepID=UPI0037842C4E